MKHFKIVIALIAFLQMIPVFAQLIPVKPSEPVGDYFSKKKYVLQSLPTFEQSRDRLPSPILDDRPELVEMYWKCWQIAFTNLHQPPAGSPFVSNWIDAAFKDYIYQWDTIFMTMFARYGNGVDFPAAQSLDNFYCSQHRDGYICREIHWSDGEELQAGGPANTINPPLFSWAEVESFKLTGDKSRFAMVLPVLEKYVEWLNRDGDPQTANGSDWEKFGRRAAGSVHQLYWNTGLGSGMDNTPRRGNGWVDMSCQMVIQYNNLATMCDELNLPDKAKSFRAEAKVISDRINKWCWNETDGFYYDVQNDGTQFKVKTLGGFWPMLAGVAAKPQAEKLVAHLKNEKEFWRPFVFPSLSADDPNYHANGSYWRGGVWAPTNLMVIKGLENYGYEDLATESTDRYLTAMAKTFKTTGTIWENYSPESYEPGQPAKNNFVGWSGDGPIALLIENILGFRADGVDHKLIWRITRIDRHGIERLRVGNATVSAICDKRASAGDPAHLAITTDQPFTLIVKFQSGESEFRLSPGTHELTVK